MIQRLKDFIEKLKLNPRISTFDEASTKQAIVLPMLHLLGWNTYDVEEVTPEFSVESRRVDYALRVKKDKFFLEVKNTGEDLGRHEEQLLDYSYRQGVELATLTNGITWWFYLPMKKGEWSSRKFYTIDIIQQEIDVVSSKLVALLSRDNLLSGAAVKEAESIYEDRLKKKTIKDALPEAWNKIISDTDTLLVDLLAETTEKICGFKPEIDDVKQFLKRSVTQPLPKPILPTISGNNIQKIRSRSISSFSVDKSRIEICLNSIYTPKKFALIPLPRECRSFFPGFKIPFILETDIGSITTKVTSGPEGTEIGDLETGNYIQGGLKPWYNKHRELKEGDRLIFDVIEPGKRYKLSISQKSD